jgi:hypothetical protein
MKNISLILLLLMSGIHLLAQTPVSTEAEFLGMTGGGDYYLVNDITVTEMYPFTFTGTFDGGGNKITLGISSNVANVGLFPVLEDAIITNLIISGEITGGSSSENVGALAGKIIGLVDSCGMLENITNLAEVKSESPFSNVGGIGGFVEGYVWLLYLVNTGTIIGGKNVGGIVGEFIGGTEFFGSCLNSGTIKHNKLEANGESVGGIAGTVSINYLTPTQIFNHTNIGKIEGADFDYSGGIFGHFNFITYWVRFIACMNAGVVDGAKIAVGGVVGYFAGDTLWGCLNVN